MTLRAVEVAVAFFQEHTRSPCPGMHTHTHPASPRRGGQSESPRAGQETLPGGAGGEPEGLGAPGKAQPGGRGGSPGRSCVRSAVAVWSAGFFACVVLQSPAHLSRGC